MNRPLVIAAILVACASAWSGTGRDARAGTTTIAEPVIEENITDIDGNEVDTVEVDATAAFLHARAKPVRGSWDTGVEAEWRATSRLGVGLELSLAGPFAGRWPGGASAFHPRAALSWVIVRDRERRIFIQAEATGRYEAGTEPELVDVAEPAFPYTLGVRAAVAVGPVVLRAALLGEAGHVAARAPLRTSAAALFTPEGQTLPLSVGVEAMLDLAADEPFTLAPEALVLVGGTRRLPVRIGVAVPVTLGGAAASSLVGLVLRIVLEPTE